MQIANEFTWIQAITLAIAFLGAVLGVINTWRAINNDRVRLKVTPISVYVPGTDTYHLAIEVINQSGFNVTVTHVGFRLHGTDRYLHLNPDNRIGKVTPHVFEARTVATFHMTADAADLHDFEFVKDAFVKTACGRTIYGSSPALIRFVDHIRLARASSSVE